MSHDHLVWPRLSCREQYKEGDEEADRENDGKTPSESGLALSGTSYCGKLRTARSEGSWLQNLQWRAPAVSQTTGEVKVKVTLVKADSSLIYTFRGAGAF